MEDNKFFTLLWRLNGIIIAVTGVLAAGVLLYAATVFFPDSRAHTARNPISVNVPAATKEHWELGGISPMIGHSVVTAPLYSNQDFSLNDSYGKSYWPPARNYLFINTAASTKRWLFPHTKYLIIDRKDLYARNERSLPPAVAVLYQIIKADTNQDARLSEGDLIALALVKPDGSGYQEVLSDIERVAGSELVSQNELLVIYQKNAVAYSATINLINFQLIDATELPAIE